MASPITQIERLLKIILRSMNKLTQFKNSSLSCRVSHYYCSGCHYAESGHTDYRYAGCRDNLRNYKLEPTSYTRYDSKLICRTGLAASRNRSVLNELWLFSLQVRVTAGPNLRGPIFNQVSMLLKISSLNKKLDKLQRLSLASLSGLVSGAFPSGEHQIGCFVKRENYSFSVKSS
jgi:hypothetical protein